ncbi:MAG: PaaI family thioesterase [Bdellovibrionales bacterium]
MSNDWCFGCGKLNPIGLKLAFEEIDGVYVTHFTPHDEHQSYDGTIHGGIISTLLDEAMGRYLYVAKGRNVATAKLEVRFRKPTPVGQELTVSGWVVRERGKMIEMEGKVALQDGTVTAEGRAMMMEV